MSEDSPIAPKSKKGFLRAQAADVMLRGDAPVAIARAADFIGPGAVSSIFGDRFWPKLLAGRAVEYLGDLDQLHTYSYAPDVADGMVTLGTTERADVFGKVWHLPALPAETTRAWIERLAAAAHVEPRARRLAPWLLRIAGLFIPEAGELPEMIYQWRAPFVLDDRRFRAAFGASPTPAHVVARDSIAWAREHYGVAATAPAIA
jgi:nucleoside-diphosphate-sugar epimerase